ncbi:MAG: alpha-E domain-containing protein [Candidatus Poribacteria bacterium]|nr:alpha-E domain-containing protein [Candidatus Poribacteria bacterium]MDE0314237.1 alpha-E domain-containing protein [Candidatus Poribacteria bacterium]
MLSRVAESIYWMSRYIERAENVARFVDVNLQLILDQPVGMQAQWEPLVATTGDDEEFEERYGEASREAVLKFLTFDTENPNSIISCLRAARENARSIRENISSEMWEKLNDAYLMVTETPEEWAMTEPHQFFTDIKVASHLFMGLTDNIMSHSEAWHFCQLGRLIERADKTSRIVDVKYFILLPSVSDVNTPFDDIQWGALLHSASAFEMYRRTHGLISPNNVVAFLLLDREFPRSVLYCLSKAEESLHAISGTPLETFSNSAEQGLGQLRSEFAYAQVDQVLHSGLHEFLDAFQTKLNDVGEDIYKTFFALRPVNGEDTQSQFQMQ